MDSLAGRANYVTKENMAVKTFCKKLFHFMKLAHTYMLLILHLPCRVYRIPEQSLLPKLSQLWQQLYKIIIFLFSRYFVSSSSSCCIHRKPIMDISGSFLVLEL
jgi:hypothetical protein